MGRGGGRRGGAGGSRNAVSFARPDEPAFLRRMKEQLGYKETGPTIDSKREDQPELTDADTRDRDDEKPTVVVLQSGKAVELSKDEVDRLGVFDDEKSEEDAAGGKIVFKKPTKRPATDNDGDGDEPSSAKSKIAAKLEKKSGSSRKVKNKCLLSFDDEENDDNEEFTKFIDF